MIYLINGSIFLHSKQQNNRRDHKEVGRKQTVSALPFFLWKLSIIYRGLFKSFQEIKKPIHNNKLGLPLVDSLSCGLD